MNQPRWQFGVFNRGILIERFSTDVSDCVTAQQEEAQRYATRLQQTDPTSDYTWRRIRTGVCIEENGVSIETMRTGIPEYVPTLERLARQRISALRNEHSDRKYELCQI